MADTATEKSLESKLEEMLDIEKFDPPEDFPEHALLNDSSVYDEAEKDWTGALSSWGVALQKTEAEDGPLN